MQKTTRCVIIHRCFVSRSVVLSISQFICRKEVSHKDDCNNVVQLIDKTYKAHKEHLQ